MKKIFLFCIIGLQVFAQADLTNLEWKFRGPVNYNLGVKEVIDIATDPNNTQKLWACTFEDGLIFNNNMMDENSQWQPSSLSKKRVYKIKFHPNKPQIAYAIGDFVNWKSTDGGKTWSEITVVGNAARCYDIWVSKLGTVIVATKNDVFVSFDEGKAWRQIITIANPGTIKQLWVQENERIYVLKNDNTGLYSDSNYSTWREVSLDQMRREEMPYPELEEFHAYVVQGGEIYHGFTTDRRKIKLQTTYSIDGGSTYQSYQSPSDVKEVVFIGNDMVFATKQGIIIYKDLKLQERNKGNLQGEYRLFADKPLAGDNNLVSLSTRGVFLMNNIENGDAYETQNIGERFNSFLIEASTGFTGFESFATVEVDKMNYIGYSHLEGRKIIPLTNNISLYLTHSGQLGKWVGNSIGNFASGKLSIIETSNTPILDIYYNRNINTVFCLLSNGKFLTVQHPELENDAQIIKKYFELSLSKFDEVLLEELTTDGSQFLLTDKNKALYAILSEGTGKVVKQINTDAIKDLKINHFEYSLRFQKLFLATEKGIFMGEDILTNNPKWTNISKEIGEQPCTYIQLRSVDGQLSVMTRYKGIYSTTLFTESNQIITHTPRFFNTYENPYYYWNSTLNAFFCNKSKIKIDFTTNIPPNQGVKYIVEVSDINGNFPAVPFILKGEANQSPIEVEFVKPQDERANYFRFRVLAQGAVNAIGSSTPLIGINNDKNFIHETIKKVLKCERESIELIPSKDVDFAPYVWKKESDTIAETSTYKTSQPGIFKRTVAINGCNVSSVFEVTALPTVQPFFKPNVGLSYAGNTCVADSFKLFTDYNNAYRYVWYRDDVVLNSATNAEIFVKDKSKYKILVTTDNGCSSISEEIQLKTCNNGQDTRAIIITPPTIAVDKYSIYPNEKAVLRVESCSNVNLQWLKNDQVIVGANQKTLEVSEMGNYALQIEKFGCVATTNAVRISVETILSAEDENPSFTVEVYPNPTEEKLFISIPAQINIPIDVKMTDISGKLMGNYNFSTSNNQFIDLKSFQTGMYYLVFEMQGKRVVKKIIKNN